MQHIVCMRKTGAYVDYVPVKTYIYNNVDNVNISKNDLLTSNTNNTNTSTSYNINNNPIYPHHNLSLSKNNKFKNFYNTHNNKTLSKNNKKVQSRESRFNNKKSINNKNNSNLILKLPPIMHSILTPKYFNNVNKYISSNNINDTLHNNDDINFDDDIDHDIDLNNILDEFKILFDTNLITLITTQYTLIIIFLSLKPIN